MICFDKIEQFHIEEPAAITIGKFDGLHAGHCELIKRLLEKRGRGLKTAVFTFDIPPKSLTNGEERQLLSTNAEKRGLFEICGVDYMLQCPFTPEIMLMEPEDFVAWLCNDMNARSIIVGEDCRFGHGRRGDRKMLEKLSGSLGYELEVVEKLRFEGRDVSSSYIREEIKKGNMETASRLLGRPYSVEGRVLHGNRIGTTIGIPTVNIRPEPEKLLPPYGVYASTIDIGGERFYGASDVGMNPTIREDGGGPGAAGVETHILRFNEETYGKWVRISFERYVRPEMRFESLPALQSQIRRDIEFCKDYYKNRW